MTRPEFMANRRMSAVQSPIISVIAGANIGFLNALFAIADQENEVILPASIRWV